MISKKIMKLFNTQFPKADIGIDDLCFNIMLESGDMFGFCFYVDEDEKTLSVVSTDEYGFERGKIINKKCIESISLLYSDDLELETQEEEKMFS